MPPAINGQSRTRPGSKAHQIAELVREVSRHAPEGVTIEEIRRAYRERVGPLPRAFTAQVFSLVRRRILVATGGRSSVTRYCHSDDAVIRADFSHARRPDSMLVRNGTCAPQDDAMLVLRALEAAHSRAGRPVSTREIAAQVRADGGELQSADINAVRVRLATLARPRRRGHPEWWAPRVQGISVVTTTGRSSRRWAPMNAELSPVCDGPDDIHSDVLGGSSDAEALRCLVITVQGILERPVSRSELAWWRGAHPCHPVAIRLSNRRLGAMLDAVTLSDRRGKSGPGRMRRVRERDTCWGGAPSRYWVGVLSSSARLQARAVDAAMVTRAGGEMASLSRLATRAARARGPEADALTGLIHARREALRAHVRDALGGDAVLANAAITAALSSLRETRRWATVAPGSRDARGARVAGIAATQQHLEALASWYDPAAAASGFRRIGPQSALLPRAISPFINAAALELDADLHVVRRACLISARRAPTGQRVRNSGAVDRGAVGVDRVDALLRMYRLADCPKTQAWLAGGEDLLGPVLRDPAPFGAVLEAAAEGPLRRAALVALGLLGQTGLPSAPEFGPVVLFARILAGDNHRSDVPPGMDLVLQRLRNGRLLSAFG